MTPQHCQALGWGAGPHGSESVPQQPPARAAFTPSHSQWHQTLLATSSFVLLALPAPHSWFPALCSLQLQFESLLTLSPLSDLTAVTSRVCPEPSSLEELRPSFPAAANVSVGWGPESVSRADILSEPQAPGLFHLDQHKHLKLSKSRTEPAPPPPPLVSLSSAAFLTHPGAQARHPGALHSTCLCGTFRFTSSPDSTSQTHLHNSQAASSLLGRWQHTPLALIRPPLQWK